MREYISLILGGGTATVAFLWMLYRIHRTEHRRQEQKKAAEEATKAAVASSTVGYLERPEEVLHGR